MVLESEIWLQKQQEEWADLGGYDKLRTMTMTPVSLCHFPGQTAASHYHCQVGFQEKVENCA